MKSASKPHRTLVALVVSLLLVLSMMPVAQASSVNAITRAGNQPLYVALHAAPYKLDPANTGTITSFELASLTDTIDLLNKGIVSLNGLQYAVNATTLDASNNKGITDITPVTGMRKLQRLYANNTGVENLPANMSGLSSLNHMSIISSPVKATAANKASILSLPHLKKYDPNNGFDLLIQNTNFTDVRFLSKAAAPGLRYLSWGGAINNQPADYSTLAPLTQVETLNLGNDRNVGAPGSTALSTIARHMTGLRDLRLQNCGITDLSALSGMTNLGVLTIDNNYVSDLTPLAGMKNLGVLNASQNYLDPTPGSADRAVLDMIQGGQGAHYDNQIKTTVRFDAAPYANPSNITTYYGAAITLPDVSGVPDDKILAGWDTDGDGAADHAGGSTIAFARPALPIPAGQVVYKATISDMDPNCLLTGIALSPLALQLSPVFSGKRLEYTVNLPASVGSVTITPAKPDLATMTINGAAAAATTVSVGCGQSKTVSITVMSDKGNPLTYRVTVARARADEIRLLSLVATAGRLSPTFDPYTTSYTLTLPRKYVTLKATGAEVSSKITINGILAPSDTFRLAPGKSMKITVKVESAYGMKCTYTITIIRTAVINKH